MIIINTICYYCSDKGSKVAVEEALEELCDVHGKNHLHWYWGISIFIYIPCIIGAVAMDALSAGLAESSKYFKGGAAR